MAAATATTQREQWERQALQLAEASQTPAARLLAAERFRRVYGVQRGSGVGEYVVLLTPFDGRVVCDCLAGQHGRPCCHAGAVLTSETKRLARVEAADADRWVLVENRQW